LPAVAGFLVMGALVGPGGFGLVSDPESVRMVAEFGVVFLLFEIGLELPFDRLRRGLRTLLGAGGLQVGLTLAGVAGAAVALGVPTEPALVLGALVAMSSTAVVMRMLADRGEIDAPHGQLAVGILLFQDLCIVPFLLAVPILASEEPLSLLPVATTMGQAAAALALFFVAARLVLPRLLDAVARLRSRDLFTLSAVLLVLGAAVAAEAIGLTLAVGAFLAGLAASATPYGLQLFAEVLPLRGVLLGIFFTAVGMLLEPSAAMDTPGALTLLVLAAVPGKALLIAGVVGGLLRQGGRLGVRSGLVLAQTGEFSFVLAAIAAQAGILETQLQQVFIASSVVTLIATPFLVRAAPALARWLLPGSAEPEGRGRELLSDHVVVVGFGMAGRNVARVLRALEIPWVAIEANVAAVQEAQKRGDHVVFGDGTRPGLLEHLGVARARMVLVVINDPVATRGCVTLARALNPRVPILARTRYLLEVDQLHECGANVVVADELEATIDLVSRMLRLFGIPEGAVDRFAGELRDEAYELLRAPAALGLDPWLTELLDTVATQWVEVPQGFPGPRSLAELELRARTGASVLAVDRGGHNTPNPGPDFGVEAGDRLLLFGPGDACRRARELLGAA
ncbi:MAG: cation:proton antiporter, partial [Myxococcota bacterium]|nr:cation:proton antiporter [Myxococcota bacterium]